MDYRCPLLGNRGSLGRAALSRIRRSDTGVPSYASVPPETLTSRDKSGAGANAIIILF